jgi:hypothetical protein
LALVTGFESCLFSVALVSAITQAPSPETSVGHCG